MKSKSYTLWCFLNNKIIFLWYKYICSQRRKLMNIIEIRAGEGGDDAKTFMGELSQTYQKYLTQKGWTFTVEVADALIRLTTNSPLKGFQAETGGHRIQRIPANERRGRVHTSTVTVSVLQQDEATIEEFPDSDFSIRFYSGTGKGGQRRNKVQSCVTITHIPTGLSQNANGRSRGANVETAMMALTERLRGIEGHSKHDSLNTIRSEQIGSGMRGDKIRTYRFRDDIVTDHRTGKSMSVKKFMRGQVDGLWKE